jgi:hypothetical protein
MSPKDPLADNLNERINLPQVKSGLYRYNAGGSVKTDWKDIRWTKKKLFFTFLILGLPYVTAVVASFANGVYLITFILVGLGVMVVLLYKVVRWLDRNHNRF